MNAAANMPTGGAAIFWGVITFSILVIIHEGGHFLAARGFGVKVHEFMIGLPGPGLRIKSKRTGIKYGVTAIPLGGYVRIAGMEPGAEDELLAPALESVLRGGQRHAIGVSEALNIPVERASSLLATLADWGAIEPEPGGDTYLPAMKVVEGMSAEQLLDQARAVTYRGRKTWQRLLILANGVLFNLLAAILIFTITLSVWGYDVPSLKLAEIVKGSAAATAGLHKGDVLRAVNGQPIKEWPQLLQNVDKLKPGQPVVLTVQRDGRIMSIRAVLGKKPGGAAGPFLGVGPGVERKHFTVFGAAVESVKWTGLVFVAIARFFDPRTFMASVQNARSVVGISYEVASAAKGGAIEYAWIVALLSLSLGVMNILPIPPLDGGKVALEIVERLRRRPLRREVALGFSAVGAVLLFSLIFYLMYADIMRYIVKG